MTLKAQILEAVAANLREFGYPDAKADNITSTHLFSMFGRDQVQGFKDKHAGNAEVATACDEIFAEMDAAQGIES